MVLYENEVEVINVSRATSALDGSLLFQVVFGIIGKPGQGIPTAPGSKEIAANTVIAFFKSKKETPYKVGTKYIFSISDNGDISIKKRR